jgi:hypothetical protein
LIGKEIFARKLVFPIFFDTFNFKIIIYIIKEFVQPKKTPSNREFLIWKERGRGEKEGVREKGVGRWVSRQAYLRLGFGEIERRDRDT